MSQEKTAAGGARVLECFWQPVEDWTQLQGLFIEIHSRGSILDRGRVDAITDDGSVLWLAHEGAATRRLITKQEGAHVKLLETMGASG